MATKSPKPIGGPKRLNIGLVALTFKVYTAIEAKETQSHFVRKTDAERVAHTKTVAGEAVPAEEVGRAYTSSTGERVEMDPREFNQLLQPLKSTFVLDRVSPLEHIPAKLHEKTYFL